MPRVVTDGSDGKPDWRPAAVRCGLELSLIALSTVYLTLELGSSLLSGVVLMLGLLGSVSVLFWCLDDHVLAWVRYASSQTRRRQRARRRQRVDRSDDSE